MAEPTPTRMQKLVDALAVRLDRAVVLDDPDLRPLFYSPHGPEAVDRVRTISILRREAPPEAVAYLREHGVGAGCEGIRVPASAEIGLDSRYCQPVVDAGRILGYLWVVNGAEQLSATDVGLLVDVAGAASGLLSRRIERADERHVSLLVDELLQSDPPLSCDAAATLVDLGAFASTATAAVLVATISPPPGETIDETTGMLLSRGLHGFTRDLRPRRNLTLARNGEAVAIVGHDQAGELDDRLPKLAESLRRHIEEVAPEEGWDVSVGIGPVTATLAGAARSYEGAAGAAIVAARVPQVGRIQRWSEIGIYRLLVSTDGELAESLPDGLGRLLEHPGGEMLLHTLEVYLDCAGDAQAATAELFLARGSLYYRLHRIEEIAGVDLRSGHDRLGLHLGLKLARVAGIYPVPVAVEPVIEPVAA